MKVLLTGANGFVGSHILDQLRAKSVPTCVLLRASASTRFIDAHLEHVKVYIGSCTDPQILHQALKDVTHVIHCAGSTKAVRLEDFRAANQLVTRSIVEAINKQEGRIQRLIHISSMAAGGPAPADQPARESDQPHPVSEYGKSKLAGEHEITALCKSEFVILRPPSVYGPRDTEFLRLFKAVQAHLLPRFGGGQQALSFVFVKNLADAVLTCLDHPAAVGRLFYVASPEVVTAGEFASEIAAQMKAWTLPLRLPMAALLALCYLQETVSRVTGRPGMLNRQKYRELRADGWVCDPTRMREELGFTCDTTLKQGIVETLAWYRRQEWL